MTWQLASFGLLVSVLVGGAAWYERSRPSAKLVALVAALAALAVAGRLVLAPVPNVVATTDIVLIAGFALGGAPGFAVGALAALVSNFWLGHGPWTPWQMAGWGLVGIGGAALAAVTGRRLGRLGLAAACGVAGLAYGALLDLSVMVTYGGEQSLDRYLALSARGVPFNVAHAAGNIVFALLAGPVLVRMLLRFRARLEVRWRESPLSPRGATARAGGAAAALVLVLALGVFGRDQPASAVGGDAAEARRWLERVQNPDGGFPPAPGGGSSVAMTSWSALGLEAAGLNPLDLARRGRDPIDFLRANAAAIESTTDLERTILALEGAGIDSRRFAGRDLVGELSAARQRDGSFRGQVNITAFGVLALRAAGEPRSAVRRSSRWLRHAQNEDGGWGFAPGTPSDPDSTGAALQAAAAAGAASGSAARDGARYLRRSRRADGGWALADGGPTNSQSAAWAIQGLLAVGADPGARAFRYLEARQAGDGHYRYSASSDQTPVWVTAQVLLATTESPFPIAAVPRSGSGGMDGGAGAGGNTATGGDGSTGGGSGPPSAPSGGSPSGASTTSGATEAGSRSAKPGSSGESGRDRDAVQDEDGRAILAGEPAAAVPESTGEAGGEDGDIELYLGAAFALVVLALGAGFVWKRRRLP